MLTDLMSKELDSLIEFSCDIPVRLVFTQKHLANLWLHILCECPNLSSKAVKYLIPSPITYCDMTGEKAE
jgi:hypothetical protein